MPLVECPMCGKMISPNDEFCPNCGETMKKVETLKETDNYNVILINFGNQKMRVIKEIKAVTGWGLYEAKQAVDNVPSIFQRNIELDKAQQIKKSFEELGAQINIRYAETNNTDNIVSNSNSNAITCPNCHCTNVHKIEEVNKEGSAGLFGIFSRRKVSKTYECNDCGYRW